MTRKSQTKIAMAAPVLGRLAKLPEVRALHELQKLGWRAASTTDHLHDRQSEFVGVRNTSRVRNGVRVWG